MKFLCPYTEIDAVCFACERGLHEACAFEFTAYGKKWTCTCCEPDDEEETCWDCGEWERCTCFDD